MDPNIITAGIVLLLGIAAAALAARTLDKAQAVRREAEEKLAQAEELNESTMRTAREGITSRMLLLLDAFEQPTPGCTCVVCDERRAKAGAK